MDTLPWPYNLWKAVQDGPLPLQATPMGENGQLPVLFLPNVEEVISMAVDERHQKALHLRYEQGWTYAKIGEALGVKQERIRQMVQEALRKLREPKHYYRLNAIPQIEAVRLQREKGELAKECEELKRQIADLFGELERQRVEQNLQMPLDSSIRELNLSMRSQNVLIANDIGTVGKLVSCSEYHLLGLRNMGETSLADVKKALAEYGYELRKPAGQGAETEESQ